MSSVTTTKNLDPGRVASILGGVPLVMETIGGSHTLTAGVPQADLESAIASAPDLDVEVSNQGTIVTRAANALAANATDITTNDGYLAVTSPTNAQVAAQVKELTRQSTRQARQINGLIRLVLRRFDAAE